METERKITDPIAALALVRTQNSHIPDRIPHNGRNISQEDFTQEVEERRQALVGELPFRARMGYRLRRSLGMNQKPNIATQLPRYLF